MLMSSPDTPPVNRPVNRIEIAKRYLDELRQARSDIVGSWIGGSTSRGEDTESSDIDLLILVSEGQPSREQPRSWPINADGWREGVYIDSLIFPISVIGTPEQTLGHALTATHMNHALILYDATGRLTPLQDAVRAVYMQPQWLLLRMTYWLDIGRSQLQAMQEAINKRDPLALVGCAGEVMSTFISVPLLHAGLSPSSSRGLMQLAAVNRPLHDRIAEFEGSSAMQGDDALALLPRFREWMPLTNVSRRGDAPEYVVNKAQWMVQKRSPQAAVHALWIFAHHIAQDSAGDEEKAVRAAEVATRWLAATGWLAALGWDETSTLDRKVSLAQTILDELDALAHSVLAK
jgi:hypothetical protein